MAAQSGKAIIVSVKDNAGTPAYQVVGGGRTRELSINREMVDVTNADSTSQYRELLPAVGVISMAISMDGVFNDDVGAEEIRETIMDGTIRDTKFFAPGLGTFEGKFQITEMTIGGGYNGEVTFSAKWESAGVVTFV